jgi:hypothetical protein
MTVLATTDVRLLARADSRAARRVSRAVDEGTPRIAATLQHAVAVQVIDPRRIPASHALAQAR